MRLLLDTHTFLWFIWNDPQISATALALIAEPDNDVFLSTASAWEVAIKVNIGEIGLTLPSMPMASRDSGKSGNHLLTLGEHLG